MSEKNNPNSELCHQLNLLRLHYLSINDKYRSFAYKRALDGLAKQTVQIKTKEAANLIPGIGKGIGDKIEEFYSKGYIEEIVSLNNKNEQVEIEIFTRISGIGRVKALEIISKGIKNIEQLRQNKHIKLTHHQSIGLKYLNEFETKIPMKEAEKIVNIIKNTEKIFKKLKTTICGSYRRQKKYLGDIDVLMCSPDFTSDDDKQLGGVKLKLFVNKLKDNQFITDTLALGNTKFMGVFQLSDKHLHRRLDIRIVPSNQYWTAVLYFTGSANFNKQFRAHALSNNYTVNEYSIRKINPNGSLGKPLPVESEKDIFDYIEFPYVEPKDRV
uniref:DNA-directed DNA polymerase n=1 Tax=viral metagenome TaxID=1070528 RepID=A0A6C0JAH5_9ZZZZ